MSRDFSEPPYQKLHFFMEKMGLAPDAYKTIEPFRNIFLGSGEDFADHLYKFFYEIPETRMFLRHFEVPGFLRKAWAHWYRRLFEGPPDDAFLAYLWQIGIRHVEVNLDQRHSNLGFSIARQFCERLISSEIPPDEALTVSRCINKMLDFCILVETHAYVETRAECNLEIIRGVADRVRNKIAAIGGTIQRLKRNVGQNDPSYGVYETLISDSAICERMVTDTRTFMEMSVREPEIVEIRLEDLVKGVLDKLLMSDRFRSVATKVDLTEKAPFILGDRRDIEPMFQQILLNSLEAVDPHNALLKITSKTDPLLPNRIRIEIFNTGAAIKGESDTLFSPFFSTKFYGTGFGLSIAQLAVKKNYGRMELQSVPGSGTRVVIVLPAAQVQA